MTMVRGAVAKKVVATKIVAADGSGDFTDIQTAIDSLPAGGGVVYIKEGTYTITTSIDINKNNVAIIGAGKSTKIVTNGNFQAIISVGHSGLHIEKLYLYGSGSGNTSNTGISFISVTNSTVTDCWIENFGASGIDGVLGAEGCCIRGNHISSNIGNGIILYQSGLIISNNIIENNTEDGIVLSISDDSIISANIVKGNDANNSASHDGIYMTNSDNNIIIGNRCKDNDRNEIRVGSGCNNTIVISNNCLGTDHEVAIVDNGTNTVMGPNIIDDTGNFYIKGRIVQMP